MAWSCMVLMDHPQKPTITPFALISRMTLFCLTVLFSGAILILVTVFLKLKKE
jgi:hypothetical protein